MSPTEITLLAVAGLLCGLVNTVAGGGSLILFPAMLATGMSPLSANVTNSVATWPGYVGGVLGFRNEIADQRRRLRSLVVVSVCGSITGCALLLMTPASAFDLVVPALVFLASVLVGLQPLLKARLAPPVEETRRSRRILYPSLFAATVYGGYFGGGLGIIVLAVLTLTIPDTLRRLTAAKSAISLLDGTVSVVIFSLFGPVRWSAVLVALPTTALGGYLGAGVARRINETALRIAIVVFGIAVAWYLAVS